MRAWRSLLPFGGVCNSSATWLLAVAGSLVCSFEDVADVVEAAEDSPAGWLSCCADGVGLAFPSDLGLDRLHAIKLPTQRQLPTSKIVVVCFIVLEHPSMRIDAIRMKL